MRKKNGCHRRLFFNRFQKCVGKDTNKKEIMVMVDGHILFFYLFSVPLNGSTDLTGS